MNASATTIRFEELTNTTAYVILTDATVDYATCEDGDHWHLAELQALVAGYIEQVRIPTAPALCLIVNEEGLLRDMPENRVASLLAGQRIVGDAVLMRRTALR
jgi:hypothetical protein